MDTEYTFEGKAMGTDFAISIVSENKELASALASEAIKTIHHYESTFSRFLPESELSLLNKEKDRIVSVIFLEVIQKAKELFETTHGIFNPLLQIERFGYTKSFDELRGHGSQTDSPEAYDIDFSTTRIDTAEGRVTLSKGQKLDFGGFLKGYLATLLCKELYEENNEVSGVIVNIGGDLHTEGKDSEGKVFEFCIYNPITKTDALLLPLTSQSLATSGTYKRRWLNNGEQMHHILDKSGTKNPDTDIISASVIHDDGAYAEAFTKVFFSAGEEGARKILAHFACSYVLIDHAGKVTHNTL